MHTFPSLLHNGCIWWISQHYIYVAKMVFMFHNELLRCSTLKPKENEGERRINRKINKKYYYYYYIIFFNITNVFPVTDQFNVFLLTNRIHFWKNKIINILLTYWTLLHFWMLCVSTLCQNRWLAWAKAHKMQSEMHPNDRVTNNAIL